jgi:hypothetical protein
LITENTSSRIRVTTELNAEKFTSRVNNFTTNREGMSGSMMKNDKSTKAASSTLDNFADYFCNTTLSDKGTATGVDSNI